MDKKKKQVIFCEDNNKAVEFERNSDLFRRHFRSLPPEQAVKELQNSLDGLGEPTCFNKKEIELRKRLMKEIQSKPQLWKRGAAILAPPVIGLIVSLALITENPSFLTIALVAVAVTSTIYGLEYLFKPELLEKPGETLKDLVTDSFVKEEKNSRTI